MILILNTTKLTKDNGEIGDFLVEKGHVTIIVGKTKEGYIKEGTILIKMKVSNIIRCVIAVSLFCYACGNPYEVDIPHWDYEDEDDDIDFFCSEEDDDTVLDTSWRDFCEDGSEYFIYPEDYDTEEDYIEALETAKENFEDVITKLNLKESDKYVIC